jgi:hypothetical protein
MEVWLGLQTMLFTLRLLGTMVQTYILLATDEAVQILFIGARRT